MSELVALAILAALLLAVVRRPLAWNEAAFGVPAAVLVVAVGLVSWQRALATIHQLTPTVLFLAAILAFGQLCAAEGVFDYLGALAGRVSGGRPGRLLALTVALAAGVTVVLTLDATVVLLTPVVVRTVRRLNVEPRPHLFACVHLANAGSLLLPVSNLTNLLAFSASGLSFAAFAGVMALPWLVVCVLEWVALSLFFRTDLRAVGPPGRSHVRSPKYALAVLAATVAGFVGTSAFGVAPAWAALAGVLLLAIPRVLRHRSTPLQVIAGASPAFCVFVLSLGVVVDAVTTHGLGAGLRHILPTGEGLAVLLAVAFIAAALANVVNNLPATLLLLPVVAGHPIAVLAVLLGVNIGPNLTYVGSLATLLWRRLLPADMRPSAARFHLLGALSVPPVLALATVALWSSAKLIR